MGTILQLNKYCRSGLDSCLAAETLNAQSLQ